MSRKATLVHFFVKRRKMVKFANSVPCFMRLTLHALRRTAAMQSPTKKNSKEIQTKTTHFKFHCSIFPSCRWIILSFWIVSQQDENKPIVSHFSVLGWHFPPNSGRIKCLRLKAMRIKRASFMAAGCSLASDFWKEKKPSDEDLFLRSTRKLWKRLSPRARTTWIRNCSEKCIQPNTHFHK